MTNSTERCPALPVKDTPDFFDVNTYRYELPQELIAQVPISPRDACRLMTVDRATGALTHHRFRDILTLLRPGDLLIRNDTRVMASRLTGHKVRGDAQVEILLLRPISDDDLNWEALVRPGRRLKPGTEVDLGGLTALIAEQRSDDGVRRVTFPAGSAPRDWCAHHGSMPLPPYITSRASSDDDYQTVYAREVGSAAAPTAGLHFTENLLVQMAACGVEIADMTLEVGLGTFRPVSESDIRHHVMHAERCHVPRKTLERISDAQRDGRRVIAVGTTVVRTLEGLWATGQVNDRWFETDLFIYPGYRFQVVNGLLTNFHLPGSTLLMLVAAFGGYAPVMAAYQTAVEERYRFFSFGDAMLLI